MEAFHEFKGRHSEIRDGVKLAFAFMREQQARTGSQTE